ncbi:hypothetical protein BHF71_07590 [Vulcanibacillus modesticaldus]|uniref:Divergent PAP2 family protein n=1 Tax=Vulcanibacillus modesticaldus TaxID=337097 RepID=A0A1D2YVT8_9BACI|nr:divergent PAP2 family protein [Vulcanibacillus modesticaldus]OEF99746.1 hypothetical protein BHF71_07590 [Vulcanibacillus modesticaldus]
MTVLLDNYPLISALVAMLLAQLVKFPINFILNHKIDPMIIFSNGGMPSSHSAFVSSLTTAIGIEYGFNSPFFAISTVFSLITMWDATGVRYQASKHAQALNVLIQDFHQLVEHVKYKSKRNNVTFRELLGNPLKELLGHKPFEVLMGLLFGILVALFVGTWY